MKTFVDTGAWYAPFNDLDIYHPRASAFMQKLIGQKAWLFTSDYVIDETLTLMRARLGHGKAVEFGRWVLQSPLVKLINVDEKIWQAAWNLFVRYDDKYFSFTDCTSFAIMRQLGLRSAFAFDRNFEKAGFALLPFES